jgi:ABC-2 type transport system permease protein
MSTRRVRESKGLPTVGCCPSSNIEGGTIRYGLPTAELAQPLGLDALSMALFADVVSFVLGQRIFAAKHIQVAFTHPGVLEAAVYGAVAVSLIAMIGVGLGGLIRHTAAATTALVLVIVGGVTLGQFVPAGLSEYLPVTALQAAVTFNDSAGLLRPGIAIAVLGIYAAITLVTASIRMAHRDA